MEPIVTFLTFFATVGGAFAVLFGIISSNSTTKERKRV